MNYSFLVLHLSASCAMNYVFFSHCDGVIILRLLLNYICPQSKKFLIFTYKLNKVTEFTSSVICRIFRNV